MTVLVRFALSIGAAALFAGCGGSQSPIAAAPRYDGASAAVARGFGTVIAMTKSGNATVLHTFGGGSRDGSNPYAGLTDMNGTLYGTTRRGGTHHRGTVFEIAASGAETVLHSFGGLGDGEDPFAGLVNVNGTLYGATLRGGAYDYGTVFSITPSGAEVVFHSFKGSPHDGAYPAGKLLDVKGTLYGTTKWGGRGHCGAGYHHRTIFGCGAVFKITPFGKETLLHSFDGTHGWTPIGDLINVNGILYGTTAFGVQGVGCGIVFKISTSGKESTVYNFPPGKEYGDDPEGDLLNINGTLYGTTEHGGTDNKGTVYAVTTSGAQTVLHNFTGSPDGSYPYAGLINVSGTLYGTTTTGGASDYGTVFAITTAGGESVIHSFRRDSGGGHPYAGLLDIKGTLYGTTFFGGAN
jgi:uncharacterized repeat protein (TIGR03803 family)